MEDKWVYTFPKGIDPKVYVIAQVQFEFVFDNVAVEHFSLCAKGIPPDR